jgi:hypothetical protein
MQFLRCVHAEFLLVLPRLPRTRLGFALLALGVSLVWLHGHGFDALTAILQAGALGAIVGAAGVVGHVTDRAALRTILTHPTTPLAIAAGRWLAIVLPAGVLALGCTLIIGGTVASFWASLIAAAAVGSCALAIVLPLRSSAAVPLFLFMAVAGTVAPERLVDLASPGFLRVTAAGALELGPALWHYRYIAIGDAGAVAHGLAWTGLGVLLAAAFIGRRRAGP